jgi:hypothetical protein
MIRTYAIGSGECACGCPAWRVYADGRMVAAFVEWEDADGFVQDCEIREACGYCGSRSHAVADCPQIVHETDVVQKTVPTSAPPTGHPKAYGTLGLEPGASLEEIKGAYRARVKEAHPDVGGDARRFHWVQRAYEHLMALHSEAAK